MSEGRVTKHGIYNRRQHAVNAGPRRACRDLAGSTTRTGDRRPHSPHAPTVRVDL